MALLAFVASVAVAQTSRDTFSSFWQSFQAAVRSNDLTKITEIPKLMPIVNKKPDAELFADLDATVAWAKGQGGDTTRLGIMGFCRGGRTVWEYSEHSGNVKAGVAFYGTVVDPPAGAVGQGLADDAKAQHVPAGRGD